MTLLVLLVRRTFSVAPLLRQADLSLVGEAFGTGEISTDSVLKESRSCEMDAYGLKQRGEKTSSTNPTPEGAQASRFLPGLFAGHGSARGSGQFFS